MNRKPNHGYSRFLYYVYIERSVKSQLWKTIFYGPIHILLFLLVLYIYNIHLRVAIRLVEQSLPVIS